MSASVDAALSTYAGSSVMVARPRPRFVGMLRGELFKIARLRVAWVMAGLLVCVLCGTALLVLARPERLKASPADFLYSMMEIGLSELRIFGGIAVLVIAAYVIGLEYQQGTIRVLLGRGVGRLQLLGAKVLALVAVALAGLVVGIVLEMALGALVTQIILGNLHALGALGGVFWTGAWFYLLATLISTGATLLLGVAVTVVGRSLAVGLSVGLTWFAADNLGILLMYLIFNFTQNAFWTNITGFFLGPILNLLPNLIVPARQMVVPGPHGPQVVAQTADTIGAAPLVHIDATQGLLVILAYSLVFALVAVALTWRRDVLE